MSQEKLRQQHQREIDEKDTEMEELRFSTQKRVRWEEEEPLPECLSPPLLFSSTLIQSLSTLHPYTISLHPPPLYNLSPPSTLIQSLSTLHPYTISLHPPPLYNLSPPSTLNQFYNKVKGHDNILGQSHLLCVG